MVVQFWPTTIIVFVDDVIYDPVWRDPWEQLAAGENALFTEILLRVPESVAVERVKHRSLAYLSSDGLSPDFNPAKVPLLFRRVEEYSETNGAIEIDTMRQTSEVVAQVLGTIGICPYITNSPLAAYALSDN